MILGQQTFGLRSGDERCSDRFDQLQDVGGAVPAAGAEDDDGALSRRKESRDRSSWLLGGIAGVLVLLDPLESKVGMNA